MKLFQMEFYKIASKRINLVLLILLLPVLFFVFYLSAVKEVKITVDGTKYEGRAAIQKNRELTKAYEGAFTREKAERIIAQYGFAGYDEEDRREGNFLNRFVTDRLTDFNQTGETPKEWKIDEKEKGWLLDGSLTFGYIEGWEKLIQFVMLVNIAANLFLIIALSPVFSDEYHLKTVSVLFTTEDGKKKDIAVKMAAALSYGVILYVAVNAVIFLLFLSCYGWDGAFADVMLLSVAIKKMPVYQYFMIYLFFGLVGTIMQMQITLLMSSLCKESYYTVIFSAASYLFPVLYLKSLGFLIPPGWLSVLLEKFFSWSAFYIPYYRMLGSEAAFPELNMLKPVFILFILVFSFVSAYRKYRKYETL